jgi:hypothetical protein
MSSAAVFETVEGTTIGWYNSVHCKAAGIATDAVWSASCRVHISTRDENHYVAYL